MNLLGVDPCLPWLDAFSRMRPRVLLAAPCARMQTARAKAKASWVFVFSPGVSAMVRNDTTVIPQFSVDRSPAPSSPEASSSGDEMMCNFCHEAVPGGRERQGIHARAAVGPWFKKGSGTVAGTARRVLRTSVPDPFLNQAAVARSIYYYSASL